MKKVLILALALCLVPMGLKAQTQDNGDWTEVCLTFFDQVDGDFQPRLTGGVVNFISGKGIGAFLGEDNAVGPITLWRVWHRPFGEFNVGLYFLASTDVSDAASQGLFTNATFGVEPRIHWLEFGNAELCAGILSTTFQEGEPAVWTPYIKLAFKP